MNENRKEHPRLSQLSPANEERAGRSRFEGVGFNVKKRPRLIRLVPLGVGSNMEAINRVEQDLLRDIRDIDLMLQKREGNMIYIHGFLLSEGISTQLLREFYSALQVVVDAVEDGFYLWRLREYNQDYQLVSSKLVHSPRHFPQKLLDKSIENLVNYDLVKHQQSLGKGNNRWNISVKVNDPLQRNRRIKTDFEVHKLGSRKHSNGSISFEPSFEPRSLGDRKLTDFRQITDNYKSHSNPLHLQSNIETKRKEVSLRSEPATDETPSLEQLSVMLRKEPQVVSIWLPPSACPQLMGVMSIEIKEKAYNVRSCLIKKYFWYRHGLSRRLFDSILHWIALQFDAVTELSITTSRDAFNAVFSSMGWQLASWVSEDRIRITYSGL